MIHETCNLFNIIPRKEIDRVFRDSPTASAEMNYTFMGFEEIYKAAASFIPKDFVVIDIGCAYAPQAYYFVNHNVYIGVDINLPEIRFETHNSEFLKMSAQDFCRVATDMFDMKKVFAICSYVPDEKARKIVRETFPNCLVYYP